MQAKIRSFRDLRDGKEDPQENIEDIALVYEQEGHDERTPNPVADKVNRLLFRQNLEGDVWTWYTDLDRDTIQDWQGLRAHLLASHEITEKDAQAKQFEFRMKVAPLKQGDK